MDTFLIKFHKGPIDNYSALIQVMTSTLQTETFLWAIHEYIFCLAWQNCDRWYDATMVFKSLS